MFRQLTAVKEALTPKVRRRADVETLTPLVSEFLQSTSTHNEENAVNKQARQVQKEAQRRAKAVANALRGERQRRWPYLVAAFATGTTIGIVAGFAIARREELWERLRSSGEQMREKVSTAASTVRDKADSAVSKAGDLVEDRKAALGGRSSNTNSVREAARI